MSEESASVGVIIVDDHQMFADSLARVLADDPVIDVLGVARTGAEGIALAQRARPRVALVDYQMPDQDGVAVASAISALDVGTMVVMLTGSADDRVLLAAIEAGCSGFLTKDRAATDVVEAVHGAAAGEALISPALLARLLPKLTRQQRTLGSDLTDRERDLLAQLVHGGTNKAIAEQLHLSVNTVRNYMQSILMKLGAHSKLEAASIAVREGLVDYPTA